MAQANHARRIAALIQTRHVVRSERGSILILTALSMSMLLGIAALSVDAAFWFDRRNTIGAAADAAALAATQELKRGGGGVDLQRFANHEVAMHFPAGFNVATGPSAVATCPAPTTGVNVCVNAPPVNGAFAGQANYVEVLVSQRAPIFFGSILSLPTFTISNRSVAGLSDSHGCMYALSTSDTTYTLDVHNGASVSVPNCAVQSNSDMQVDSTSSITASQIALHDATPVGTGTKTCTLGGTCPQGGVPASTDPFATMDKTAIFGGDSYSSWTCTFDASGLTAPKLPTITGTYTLNPGVYCGDASHYAITIQSTNPNVVTFNPGVYVILGGGLFIHVSTVSGSRVSFFFTGNASHPYSKGNNLIDTDGPDNFTLTAPTTGLGAGLLFVEDNGINAHFPTQGLPVVTAKFSPKTWNVDGILYFPTHALTFDAGSVSSSSSNYNIFIANTIEIKGGGTQLKSNYTSGGLTTSPVTKAAQAE